LLTSRRTFFATNIVNAELKPHFDLALNALKRFFDRTVVSVYIHTMKRQLDMASVENCACFNVRRISRVITQFFDAEAGRHGIRPTQTPILGALQARDGWSMAELSAWLGMERTTLVRNLRPLQRDGLVRARGGGRGGHVELELTEKGRAALAKMLPAWRSAQDKVVAILGKKKWSAIISDLENVARKLKEQ
jgi:DNA-binding MarR family transcriptional regulator